MRLFLLFLLFLISCSNQKNMDKSNTEKNMKTIWVDSTRGDCLSSEEHGCLKIKFHENDSWTIAESDIEGFDFVAGNIYKLSVKEVTSNSGETSYKLIEQLSSRMDPKLRLHDLWSLRKINGKEVKLMKERHRPLLEIYVSKMSIGGSAGCNNLRGSINSMDAKNISFGKIATTKMMCQDSKTEQLFLNNMKSIVQYKIEKLSLILIDASGNEALTFKKVD